MTLFSHFLIFQVLIVEIFRKIVVEGSSKCITYHGSIPFLFLRHPQFEPRGTCMAYYIPEPRMFWSFDPLGRQRCTNTHLPTVHYDLTVEGLSLSPNRWEALRKFHELKGFDPDSQDIACNLDLPLFVLSDG